MGDNAISKILSKIPLPRPPEFTNDLKKDKELLEVYKKNLDTYRVCLDAACLNVFSTAITNSRCLKDTYSHLEDILQAVEKDKERVNSGMGTIFVPQLLGCSRFTVRMSKQQLISNPEMITNTNKAIIEDQNQAVFILRFDKQKSNFSITDCPCCEQNNIANKEELILHIRTKHITCKSFTQKKKIEEKLPIIVERVEFDDLGYEPSELTLSKLTGEINELYLSNYQDERENKLKDSMINYIQKRLLAQIPNCELKKYGSSCNGFGVHDSDIDLCMIVDIKTAFKHPKFFNQMSKDCGGENATNNLCELIVLSKICNALGTGSEKVVNLELRDSARVRIINFKTPTEPQFEIDMCLNNKVALENTALLRTYSLIDERVPKLGISIKMWAKAVDVCNPRNGTLSAYAYVILVINYLQKIPNPLLPCLQDSLDASNVIDGIECGFDHDYEKYIPVAMMNTDDEGTLLFGFFKFYSFFDWRVNTVDIRFKQYATKKNSDYLISIQDPFELNRNLGDVIKNVESAEKIINSFKFALKELSRGKPFNRILNNPQ
jgi:DNA polymerase sigma